MLLDRYRRIPEKEAVGEMEEQSKISIRRQVAGSQYTKIAAISLAITVLAAFGLVNIVLITSSHINAFGDRAFSRQVYPDRSEAFDSTGGTMKSVVPIPCHSHNDYKRQTPLFDALHTGCTSVEVDLWLVKGRSEILVGHKKASRSSTRILGSLYLKSIEALLDRINQNISSQSSAKGLFELSPNQTTVLLLDFKSNPIELLARIQKAIEPLRRRNYLSFWNGEELVSRPITVVLTGRALDLPPIAPNAKDIFFDAPLAKVENQPSRWNRKNAYYASTSFRSSIGSLRNGRLSSHQLAKLRSQIRAAKSQGLKTRYWDTPSWPTSLRKYVWQTLFEEGVDVLNVDDLHAAAFLDWRHVGHSRLMLD